MACGTCGAIAAVGARYCDRCGVPLGPDGLGRAGPAAWSPEDGDRRVVTALFADLVDYVRMVAEHDPEDVRARVRGALQAMAAAIRRFEGTREKFIGDAVFAVFGWPTAHDDDAIRASMAALAIRSALRDLDDGTEPLEVRIGISTGEVVTGPGLAPAGDLSLTGSAITTAARIQSVAAPGEILLDSATVAAARGRLIVEDRGSVVLRGQQDSVALYALASWVADGAHGAPRPRPDGLMIGRTPERARLRSRLERVASGASGGAVMVVGEAGIGKTRLLSDLEADARSKGVAWTWIDSTSYGQSEPYRFARLFAQAAADEHAMDSGAFARTLLFTPDVDPRVVRRFGGAIAAIARDADFSGWEAEARDTPSESSVVTATLVEVAERYVDRLLELDGPRVVVVDDVHWMDRSSDGMVEVLVERSHRLPLLVLLGARPEALPSWAADPAVERVDLDGLSMPESAHLATEVAQAAMATEDARRIHERTAGNPLFITETVRAFLIDGTLARHDGRISMAEHPASHLPVTLRAVLGARIGALPREAREALGVAAVVGMRFDWSRVEGLMRVPPSPATLERLLATGLIVPSDGDGWRFSHPLLHDTAYVGLLASRRREIHGRLADQMEAQGDPLSTSVIALHRAASGDAQRAIPLLDRAAETALAMGAAAEAAAFWLSASRLESDPDRAAVYRARASAIATPIQAPDKPR